MKHFFSQRTGAKQKVFLKCCLSLYIAVSKLQVRCYLLYYLKSDLLGGSKD